MPEGGVITVELPWPARALSPNARVHRKARASAAKKARLDAQWAATVAGGKQFKAERVNAYFTFYPPIQRGRKHDDDNLLGSIKSYRDGIADVIGIDDNRWTIAKVIRGEPVPGGAVRVELEPAG